LEIALQEGVDFADGMVAASNATIRQESNILVWGKDFTSHNRLDSQVDGITLLLSRNQDRTQCGQCICRNSPLFARRRRHAGYDVVEAKELVWLG